MSFGQLAMLFGASFVGIFAGHALIRSVFGTGRGHQPQPPVFPVGEKFLQPLKSQGVFSMEDSAMILRVKFMTRPGDQFVVRKKVYARIRELFEQNNITFAHREVTVRLAGDGSADPEKLTDDQKKQISGAVLPVVDEAQNSPEGSSDGR